MEITGVLPTRSQSKRTRSSNSSRSETTPRGDRGTSTQTQSSTSSTSTPIATGRTTPTLPRSSRPSILSRTNSAPLVPLSKGSRIETVDEDDSDAYNPRDSVAVSIKDDPFFRNYQTPNSESLARQLRTATYANSMHGEDTLEPPPRSSKRPSVDHSAPLPPQSRSGMADINIAIIGSGGVGKSTLIQRALGLRSLPTSISSSQRMYVDNVVYMVSLIELDLESFDIISERRVQWPKQINGHIVPRMDGALLLYDVMNRDSIAELPQTLNALVTSALPTILVSCKCDNPESSRQIDVESMESACLQCVEAVKTAANVPESARLCLSAILKHVLANRIATLNNPDTAGPRRRANSSAYLETPSNENGRPLSQHSKHSRASSEFSTLIAFPSPTLRGQPGASRNPNSRTNLHNQFKLPSPDEAPPLSAHPAFRLDGSQEDPDSEQQTNPPIPSPGLAKAIDNAFLDIEESDADSSNRYSDDIPILQRNDDGYFDKPSKVAGISFEELVDRLLSQNMSRADSNFSDIFLCLYRMFAAPGELFAAILNRLERIADDKNTHYLTRTAAQLRIITVVAKWVSSYPGDFASPTTSRNLDNFINNLATEPVFAAAASEMRGQLQSRVVVDDDTGWARTDADVDNEQNGGSESVPSSPVRQRTHASTEFSEEMSNLNVDDDEGGGEIERQQSGKDSSSSARAASPTQSVSLSFDTVEDYEKEAATMVPRMTLPLTKFRYHIFMDTSDDDIADEMTRIDWVMFSSIRLRDLVRHVSLPLELKAKSKSLANVNRMINHFNHIAKWVANMILMRDKPKHRAQMLEKFMAIALKLRQLNNYNSLAAVLAGINGSAIYRLNQTRALVPAEVHKRFYRLVMLMSPQKSHFSYRLAWENSSLPRIPFIPLTRRDLVSAEEGSRTFVGANGERINWKKFEVLSEVILPIMKSQVVPYPNLKKHDIARELILDCRMPTDDEEIYQRSVQLESPASGAVEPGKKKFPWFSK